MECVIGFDFGTTNSAIALKLPGQDPILIEFSHPNGKSSTYRSILYFDPEECDAPARPRPTTGSWAIEAYLEQDSSGRLMQSLKTWLSSRMFEYTRVGRHRYSLEDLISALLMDMRAEAEASVGPLGMRAVVGRPVHLSRPANVELDNFAIGRLRRALERSGFTDVVFEYEPVAAAYFYEQRLETDECVLIADFGGGTSDFTLMKVGPEAKKRRAEGQAVVLGTSGVPLAGNAFDSRIVQHLVAPCLGLGSEYKTPFGKVLKIPASIFKLRWHELSTLNSPQARQDIQAYLSGALEPEKLEAFLHLVDFDLSYPLYQAVERTKVALSSQESSIFRFSDGPIQIEEEVTRADFSRWIQMELKAITSCVDELMESANMSNTSVDRVFLTGGSSFIPAVRDIFASRFGADKLRSGQELTSVATGLALHGGR